MKLIAGTRPNVRRLLTSLLFGLAFCATAPSGQAASLVLEATIALPNTSGRIDHLAVDLARTRLFVTELGNGSVDVVDLGSRKVLHRIVGLNEPQGVAYVPKTDVLAVASAGDGTLRLYSGTDFALRNVMKLGDDADNLRLGPLGDTIVVGFGSGELAIVDPTAAAKLKGVMLPAHPEGFQLSASDDRAFVNVPDAHQIVVADLRAGRVIAQWPTPHLASNFPMTLADGNTVAVVFRSPARLVRFEPASGRIATMNDTCGDADDVFFDAKRRRYYVSCGAGVIDVFPVERNEVGPRETVSTTSGARTSLFVPELDRLFLAVRAGLLGSGAAIEVYRPTP